jgi:hypothetical protein
LSVDVCITGYLRRFDRWRALREKINLKEQQDQEDSESDEQEDSAMMNDDDKLSGGPSGYNNKASQEEPIVVTDAETDEEYGWRSLLVEFGKT